jgi:hypothetical protein
MELGGCAWEPRTDHRCGGGPHPGIQLLFQASGRLCARVRAGYIMLANTKQHDGGLDRRHILWAGTTQWELVLSWSDTKFSRPSQARARAVSGGPNGHL